MHLGQCVAGTSIGKDGDPRWETPCLNGAGGYTIIDAGEGVGVVLALCRWHHDLYRAENLFTFR